MKQLFILTFLLISTLSFSQRINERLDFAYINNNEKTLILSPSNIFPEVITDTIPIDTNSTIYLKSELIKQKYINKKLQLKLDDKNIRIAETRTSLEDCQKQNQSILLSNKNNTELISIQNQEILNKNIKIKGLKIQRNVVFLFLIVPFALYFAK